ncbi:hypothetical protein ACLOJK_012988 [Asimina triloba]
MANGVLSTIEFLTPVATQYTPIPSPSACVNLADVHPRSPYGMPPGKVTIAANLSKFPRFFCSHRTALLANSFSFHYSTGRFVAVFPLRSNEDVCTQLAFHSPSLPAEVAQETFFRLLRNACKEQRSFLEVGVLHSRVIKTCLQNHTQVGTCLLDLYARCRHLDHAHRLFDDIPKKDVRAWTILITGYAHDGLFEMVVGLFSQMLTEGVLPNCFTLASVVKGCAGTNDLNTGKKIHGWILRNGIRLDIVLQNAIIDLYSKCGFFEYGRRVFEMMNERDSVSWNIVMGAYLRVGDVERSLELFRKLPFHDVSGWNTVMIGQMRNGNWRIALELLYEMVKTGPGFNQVTFSVALMLASTLSMLELGRETHGQLLRVGTEYDLFISNSLIDMYCKCRKIEYAIATFDRMCNLGSPTIFNERLTANAITWSSMVSGYVQNGRCEDALRLFCQMVQKGVKAEPFTLTSLASACANAGILEQGRQIHAFIEKYGHCIDSFLASAMIDMYAKCGSLDDAQAIFDRSSNRSVVLWTAIISGHALHGRGKEAIQLFELMLEENIRPNEISFVGVLSACSHAGLFEEGHAYFRSMKEEYDIAPDTEHFTFMVDLLSRAGRLEEAKNFIFENGISHLSVVWRAFVSACRMHNNTEMAKWASEQLVQLDPFDASSYILLSNICSTTQRWAEAANMRSLMQGRGVQKRPGQSWLLLKNKVHSFIAGDQSHPQAAEIYSYLWKLIGRIKEVGYLSDTNLALHDVEEEQKEALLSYHSEKLAIAYGVMSTPCGTPIRVVKNLRVCGDCHTAIKCISQTWLLCSTTMAGKAARAEFTQVSDKSITEFFAKYLAESFNLFGSTHNKAE